MNNLRNIAVLLLLYLASLVGGYFLFTSIDVDLTYQTFGTLLTIMTTITLVAYGVIALGMKKKEQERGFYTLAAIGGKFLLFLVLLLIYWAPGKNLSLPFIIAFFVLYLMLTFFLVGVLIKALRTK